jgi:pimeloyl-ACP methyl ester carboxylesterase
MMLRLLAAAALAITAAAPRQHEEDRGRPVILMLHGRGMNGRDTAGLRKYWRDGLFAGARSLTKTPLIADRDVRLVWYADVLDPLSGEACDYAADDVRARHDAVADPNLKNLVSLVGNLLGTLTNFVSDTEAATQLRALSGDASFLSDSHKRCASERRLSDALDRANREGRPVILVAHSLGSLVAYDYLSARRDSNVVQRLVSLGSMLGSAELRRLLIGGDSTDAFGLPKSVRSWVNVRNEGDPLAVPLPFGNEIVATPPADETERHDMVAYLRNGFTAGAILDGWCAAFTAAPPSGCRELKR